MDTGSQLQEAVQVSARVRLPTDLELVAQILRKDPNPRLNSSRSMRIRSSRGMCNGGSSPRLDLGDDLAQEIFLAAWENLSRFWGDLSLENCMLGIARHKVENHCLYDHVRRTVEDVECPVRGAMLIHALIHCAGCLGKLWAKSSVT